MAAKFNLTIDNTNARVQIDYLSSDLVTVSGSEYIYVNELYRLRVDTAAQGWWFSRAWEQEYNRELFFADIVKLNGSPIGATTYADVTALILALKDTVTITLGSGVTETPSMAVYSASTTVTSGKKSVTILTDSSFAGTILGAVANADTTYTFTASPGNTLGAIAIVRSAGSFTVLTVV